MLYDDNIHANRSCKKQHYKAFCLEYTDFSSSSLSLSCMVLNVIKNRKRQDEAEKNEEECKKNGNSNALLALLTSSLYLHVFALISFECKAT